MPTRRRSKQIRVFLEDFRRIEPSAGIVFVMGADSFAEVSTWHRCEELLRACDFALLPRPGSSAAPQAPADESGDSANVDALVSEVEKMIVRELERDRGSGSPRDLVDRVWKRIDQRRRALRRLRDRQQGPD